MFWHQSGKANYRDSTVERHKITFIQQYSALRPVRQEPELNQVTGMALAHCILGKFLGVGCHYFPPPLDVPTFVATYLHVHNDARDPSSGRWNCVREMLSGNFAEMTIQGSFTCRKSTTWDRRLYFPSEGRLAEDFFALKNPTPSAGFEPANWCTKGQHATPRPGQKRRNKKEKSQLKSA